MNHLTIVSVSWLLLCSLAHAADGSSSRKFSPQTDLLSLHYDHAPDKDDGHSAAADLTILRSLYGTNWIPLHVVAVSGAYGKNADRFDPDSDRVMDVTWNDCGGWLDGHNHHDQTVTELVSRWRKTLEAGGDVWVKEGGQSDITAKVVQALQQDLPNLVTTQRVHVVQHSDWNENHTGKDALAYVKEHTDYIRIRDANAYLNIEGGDEAFVMAATNHPAFGASWTAAFEYYDPKKRLDFSDTGELMFILGLGELDCKQFRERFLSSSPAHTSE